MRKASIHPKRLPRQSARAARFFITAGRCTVPAQIGAAAYGAHTPTNGKSSLPSASIRRRAHGSTRSGKLSRSVRARRNSRSLPNRSDLDSGVVGVAKLRHLHRPLERFVHRGALDEIRPSGLLARLAVRPVGYEAL